ncbi:MAG: M16 family metallopeptidase, partial [Bacilli bacterium]
AYDDKRSYALELFYNEFGQGYPIAINSLGYLEDLNNITTTSLKAFYETLINSPFQVSGNINQQDYETIHTLLKQVLKPTNPLKRKQITYHLQRVDNVVETIIKQDIVQSNLVLGYSIDHDIKQESYYENLVFNSVFGMGSNSLLFKIIREQENLCYSINCMHDHFSNTFIIMAGIQKENYEKTTDLITTIIKQISSGEISEEQLIDAKTVLCDIILKSYDAQGNLVTMQANRTLANLIFDLENDIKMINAITLAQVMKVAQSLQLKNKFLLSGEQHE